MILPDQKVTFFWFVTTLGRFATTIKPSAFKNVFLTLRAFAKWFLIRIDRSKIKSPRCFYHLTSDFLYLIKKLRHRTLALFNFGKMKFQFRSKFCGGNRSCVNTIKNIDEADAFDGWTQRTINILAFL